MAENKGQSCPKQQQSEVEQPQTKTTGKNKPNNKPGNKPELKGSSWYTHYGAGRLISLNYGRRAGTAIPSTNAVYPSGAQSANSRNMAYPTVIGLRIGLTKPLGDNDGFDDGIFGLYSTIRSANSGKTNYDQNGLFMYVHNVAVAHSLYATLRRAYAVAKAFDAYDASVPEAYFMAMGLDHTSFVTNLAAVRDFANIMGLKLAKYAPLHLPLIERRRWMFSNIFKDGNTQKTTNYVMALRTFNYFPKIIGFPDGSSNTPAAQIVNIGAANSKTNQTSWSSFQQYCNNVMNSLTHSPSAADMAGDMLKAFGQQAIYPAEIWPVDMKAPIVYDEKALMEIQNSEAPFRTVVNETGIRVVDNLELKDYIITWDNERDKFVMEIGPDYTGNVPSTSYIAEAEGSYQQVLFNSNKDSITNEDPLISCRLKSHVDITPVSGSVTAMSEIIDKCGTEIVLAYEAVCNVDTDLGNDQSLTIYKVPFSSRVYVDTENDDAAKYFIMLEGLFSIIAARAAAAWFPATYFYALERTDTQVVKPLSYLAYDFKNLAVASVDNLASLLGYGDMSLLFVPNVIKQSKLEIVKTN